MFKEKKPESKSQKQSVNEQLRVVSVDAPTLPETTPLSEAKDWNTTASGEIQNFKRVPIVGRLPWRTQYMVFFIGIAFSLLLLAWSITKSTLPQQALRSEIALRAAVSDIDFAINDIAAGKPVDPEKVAAMIVDANTYSAVLGTQVSEKWAKQAAYADVFTQPLPDVVATATSARQAAVKLEKTLATIMPAWRQAAESGQWSSDDAVNFAQVLANLQTLQSESADIAAGRAPVTLQFATSRQNIEQAIRLFAESEAAKQGSQFSDCRCHGDVAKIGGRQQAGQDGH